MNTRIQERAAQIERIFQETHEGLPEWETHVNRDVVPRMTPAEGEALWNIVSEEVRPVGREGSARWSEICRSDALYRTALWTKVAERIIASEGSP